FARVLHVVSIAGWIVVVSGQTSVIMPAIARAASQDRLHAFSKIEQGFSDSGQGGGLCWQVHLISG
ncbi:MAG: hypothetical protein IPF48_14135, partial [Sphingomonadales bacterium]|nr:hypothetical protein [Sphingomonadales bacterium]